MSKNKGIVYLLHFDKPYKHAKHYIGFTKLNDYEIRIKDHRDGKGARLMTIIRNNNIGFTVSKIWKNVDRKFERSLKKQGGASRICPICKSNKIIHSIKSLPIKPIDLPIQI